MARVWTCLDEYPEGQVPVGTYCENAQFVEMQTGSSGASPWPQMTNEQGVEIGQAFAFGLISVAVIRIFLSPKLHT